MAGRDPLSGDLLAALDGADAEAREIIVARRVHPGHLGGLAADQRASGRLAALGDPGDDPFGDPGLELAGGELVEEE
jgi:hypothetical protein